MTALTINRLSDTVGAEVLGVDAAHLASDDALAADVLETLGLNGVLVFRDLHLEPEAQVAFCQKLGAVDESEGHHPVIGIYRVTLDKSKNASAEYLQGTFEWHIDGCTPLHGEPPQMATVLSAQAVAEEGGETEFVSTYSAFDDLSEDEKEYFASLKVLHTMEATQRLQFPNPTDDQVARWRGRPNSVHPLVWTHRDGRKSLVLSGSCDHIVDMDVQHGRDLLSDLMERATRSDRVHRHHWNVGDTVIWDNRGVMHRAVPYSTDSPREMLRTTVLGDEHIS